VRSSPRFKKMSDPLIVTLCLAAATFGMRYFGVVVGQHLPVSGPWTSALNALPGCLIVSLVAVMLVDAGPREWLGAGCALGAAVVTRSLPLTMVVGIGTVWVLRAYG